MKNRLAWGINVILVAVIAVLVFMLLGDKPLSKEPVKNIATKLETKSGEVTSKTVATVGEEQISEKEWVNSLKELYGKQVLEQLINRQVVSQLAKKNDISISDNELERQMDFFQRQLLTTGEQDQLSPEALEEEIKNSILFEEIITNDVVISEEEIQKFYDENQELFKLNKQYHLSHIVVKDQDTAEQVQSELKNGGSFATLAMELSTDMYSRTDGGDLGWLEEESGYLPEEYWPVVEGLQKGEYSDPFKTDEGYVVVLLNEVKPEKTYEFKDVKSQIRRQLAINQIQDTMSPLQFWNDIKVDWIYKAE